MYSIDMLASMNENSKAILKTLKTHNWGYGIWFQSSIEFSKHP